MNYLRNFPNGRFAEIAQMRLARLLAEAQKPAAAAPAPAAAPPTDRPAIDIKQGEMAPQLLKPSANPYSAGRYPLGRHYSVGDAATYRESDLLTGIEQRVYTLRVTKVNPAADRVVINDGMAVMDLMGNTIKQGNKRFDVPRQLAPAEFQLGKKWTAAFVVSGRGKTASVHLDVQIVRREKVTVPAGSFDAFRIEASGWNMSRGGKLALTLWLVPGVNFPIKHETVTHGQKGQLKDTERHELVALRQQVFEKN